MGTTFEQTRGTSGDQGRLPRLGLAAALLFGEYLVLSHLFNAGQVTKRGGLWQLLGPVVGLGGPLLATTAAAWFIKARLGKDPSASLNHGLRRSYPVDRLPWLVCHLFAFPLLLAISGAIFGSVRPPPGPALAWLLAWCLVVVATALSGLLAVLGGARWLRLLPSALRTALPWGVLAWLGGLGSAHVWSQGAAFCTLKPASLLLQTLGLDSDAHPLRYLLRLGAFTMRVFPNCSGHEGFGLYAVLVLAYLVRFGWPPPLALGLRSLFAGFAMIWLINVVRFAVLSMVGEKFGPGAAVASFHSKMSWVLFCTVSLGVIAFVDARRVREVAAKR